MRFPQWVRQSRLGGWLKLAEAVSEAAALLPGRINDHFIQIFRIKIPKPKLSNKYLIIYGFCNIACLHPQKKKYSVRTFNNATSKNVSFVTNIAYWF
jgi:hypothetical protein